MVIGIDREKRVLRAQIERRGLAMTMIITRRPRSAIVYRFIKL